MFKGKLALITGSTSGIGAGIAKELASKGANLIINGLGDLNEINQFCAKLQKDYGIQATYLAADMTDSDSIEQMMKKINHDLGGVDILVNNAGIQFVSPVEDFPVEQWNRVIEINLNSSFHTIRLAVPSMKQKKWGRIINIASAHALIASPFKSAYVAAKHGIAGLTKTIALEVATDGITVNANCPGYVWTPLVQAQIPVTAKTRGITEQQVIDDVMLKAQPTKKFVTIEEVAGLASYLSTDIAGSITGSIISIDGGWSAQ